MRVSALKSDSTYALPHLDIYGSYIQLRVDVKIFSPALSRPSQQRDGERPGSTLDYTATNTTRTRSWACKNLCFLLWSQRGECPASLAGLLGVQSTGEQGQDAVSCLSSASHPFAGGETARGGRQINWLYSWADLCHQLTVSKVGICLLRLPASATSSQPSPAPGHRDAGPDRSRWLLL